MSEIKNLKQGFLNFRRKYFGASESIYKALASAQTPKVMVIACSDSRSDPLLLLGAEAGELFTARNIGNMVPPFSHGATDSIGGALEYGVQGLGVKHIIILGHSDCGAVKALDGLQGDWQCVPHCIEPAQAIKKMDDNFSKEERNILLSLKNLTSYPFIKTAIEKNTLQLHGWYFSIKNGTLTEYNPTQNIFKTIE